MPFRRHNRSHDLSVIEAMPTKNTKNHTPKTLEEMIAVSKHLPDDRQHTNGSSNGSNRSYDSSSDRSREYYKREMPRRIPISRKTGFATIRTDSTDTHAAFESDAFAVLMPATRLPIIDRPVSPTKVASQTARAEALQANQEKARQARQRNNSQSVKVPSKIVSYDHVSRHVAVQRTAQQIAVMPPTPAGSFPVSPPLPQHAWARPTQVVKTEVRETRHVHGLSNITPPRKPASTSNSSVTPVSPTSCYRLYRIDSNAGATRSTPSPKPALSHDHACLPSQPVECVARPSGKPLLPLPPSIKVPVKPRPVIQDREQERVQTESRYNLYNRPRTTSSTRTSRDSSPAKSMPNFTASNSLDGDSIFGYKTKDISGTVAGASPPPSSDKEAARLDRQKAFERARAKIAERDRERAKKTSPKRTLTTRWPWLHSSGPRIAKPTTAPVVFSTPAPPVTSTPKRYIDPFAGLRSSPTQQPATSQTATPATLRPASPRKPAPPATAMPCSRTVAPISPAPAPVPATQTFDTGFAQIKSLTYTVSKVRTFTYNLHANPDRH